MHNSEQGAVNAVLRACFARPFNGQPLELVTNQNVAVLESDVLVSSV